VTTAGAGDVADRLEVLFTGLMADRRVPARQWTRVNSAAWDSLFHLTPVLADEQEFGVALTDVEVLELSSFASAGEDPHAKLAGRLIVGTILQL